MHSYDSALHTLNFLLEVAFKSNNMMQELKVYEKIALCHFYLTDIKQCKYYMTRVSYCLIDPPESELR
jgi:hypothetical protein